MKIKYMILLVLPYITSYFLIFMIALKQIHRSDEKTIADVLTVKQKNIAYYLPDSIYSVKDTFSAEYIME